MAAGLKLYAAAISVFSAWFLATNCWAVCIRINLPRGSGPVGLMLATSNASNAGRADCAYSPQTATMSTMPLIERILSRHPESDRAPPHVGCRVAQVVGYPRDKGTRLCM